MDLPLWKAALLGLVQGATEFLPVSSSGHLVVLQDLLALRLPGVAFEVVVHAGTLLAVLAAYRRDMVLLARGSLRWLRRRDDADGGARLAGLVVLGTLPAVAAALIFRGTVEATFEEPAATAAGWLLTALLLLVAQRALSGRPVGNAAAITARVALWVGLFQAAALFPGVSRSGSTIAAALLAGLEGATAARFSFLLAVPAIAGALALDLPDVWRLGSAAGPAPMVLGFAVAAASGYAAIHLLLGFLRRGRLLGFALYCALLSAAVLLVRFA